MRSIRTCARFCDRIWKRKTTTFVMRSALTAGVAEPPMTKGRVPPRSHLTSRVPGRFRSRHGLPPRIRHRVEEELPIVARLFVRPAQERVQLGGEWDLPALHRPGGRRDHGIDAVFLERAGRSPDERGYVRGHELRSVEIAPDPHEGAGREGGTDPRLREIRQLEPEQELSRIL